MASHPASFSHLPLSLPSFLNRDVVGTFDFHIMRVGPGGPVQVFLLSTSHLLGGINSGIFSQAAMVSANSGAT